MPPLDLPRVAVSACLLGEAVRYDGTDKREPALERLARMFECVSVCPEVEVGMGVPREPIRIERDGRALRLRAVESGREWTETMVAWAHARVAALVEGGLCGIVLKSRSPSCGLAGVPVCDREGAPVGAGAGFFAAAVHAAAPDLPSIDELGLRDPERYAAFVDAVRRAVAREERAP